MENQKTIEREVVLSGNGVHTGTSVELTLKPAPEDYGIVFKRVDLEKPVEIPADAKFVSDTTRSTTLEKDGVSVQTTEHLLAAVTGSDLDNLIIEVSASEMPIVDGSSQPFVDLIKKAGIKEQRKARDYFVVEQPLTYRDEKSGSEITLIPNEEYAVLTVIDFGKNIVGTQNAYLESLKDFEKEIASSRTFSFLHEIQNLLDAGLIKGGDLNNAIVYVDKPLTEDSMDKLKEVFGREDIRVTPNGVLNNLELKHSNEASRHKLLDVIGDLTLVGKRIKGKVIANKPGHRVNTQFAKEIQKRIKEKESKPPKFDSNAEPFMDIKQIRKMLPHRPPFLLVDRVLKMTDTGIVASKSVTMNEPFFVGHFPSNPVMPGVLQVEAMAQAGGIFILSGVAEPEKYLTYFLKIDKVRFKQMVVPGDVVVFQLELLSPVRRGICHMLGRAYVGEKLVCEAELLAKIVKEIE